MPVFMINKNSSSFAHAEDVSLKQTIVSTDKTELANTTNINTIKEISETQTPFDPDNRKPMEGVAVTPEADSINQVSKIYRVNEFTINSGTSIFMWLYFPDDPYENFYKFTIAFTNSSGQKIEWEYDYEPLYDLMGSLQGKYGWKKLELVYDDAKKSFSGASEIALNIMEISYRKSSNIPGTGTSSGDLIQSISTDTLSFYDVYASARTSEKTSFVKSLNYCYYSFKASFADSLRKVYTNTSYKLTSMPDIFSYIYVGKTNILLGGSQNNKFALTITVKPSGKASYTVNIGDTIYFDTIGSCLISFKLDEQKAGQTKPINVFTAGQSIIVTNFTFGIFTESAYTLNKNEILIFQFKMSEDFVANTSVSFYSEDKNVASVEEVEYNSERNIYYVKVKALKKGKTNIIATSSGKKIGDSIINEFSEVVEVSVKNNGINEVMLYILYAFLGGFGLAFIIFLLISFVNARRNIVK